MKKILLSVAALSMLIGATVFTSCKKTDTTAPTITLVGANPITVYLQSNTADPGATAVDNSGNSITSSIQSDWSAKVNFNLVGAYTVTYTVADANGNSGTATRTVNVANAAASIAGQYNVTDDTVGQTTPYPYVDNISASSTVNNQLYVTKFAAYTGGATNFYFTVNGITAGSAITIAQQTINYPQDTVQRTFTGSGTITGTGTPILTINYTELTNGTQVAGTEVYTHSKK